jgi:hypothetical protein
MGVVKDYYANRIGVDSLAIRFLFDGDVVKAHHTPKGLELEDGDEVDVIVEQCGC